MTIKKRGTKLPIVVYGKSESDATGLYSAVASGDGVVSLSNGVDSILTHESLSESVYNPMTGEIDLEEDVEMTAIASTAQPVTGTVSIFSAECSDGCGNHIISDINLSFCPSCSAELPEEDEDEEESDIDLVDAEDEDTDLDDDLDMDLEETEEEEDLESVSSESMIVVAGDTLAEAITQFRQVATQQNTQIFASESGSFVSHSNSAVNFDPITSDFAEEVEGADVTIVSESSNIDQIEAEHLVCSGCNAHHISTSSAVVNCIRCGEGLIESMSDEFGDEVQQDEFDELAALSAEIEELDQEMEDLEDLDMDDDLESESSDEDIELDHLLAEASEALEEFEDIEFESESSDDLDEDLDEDYDMDQEEDLDAEDLLESESFAEGNDFGSCSSEDDDIDIDALDEELAALDSDDDLESESADFELDEDLIDLLSESGDDLEDDSEEDDSEDFELDDLDTDLDDDSEEDDSDIEGFDIEDSLDDDEMTSESMNVDLLTALSATEDLDSKKFYVAHCGQIEGQSTWTAFYGKIPVAMCSESNVQEHTALKNIFESARFGEAVKAHASAEGIDDALAQFKFERINPEIDVDAVVSQELVSQCEARVNEANEALNAALASVEDAKNQEVEQQLDRVMEALSASSLGINRGVFVGSTNPIALRLISALSAAGINPNNATDLVNDAFTQAGDMYAEQLLSHARSLLEKPEDVAQAVIEQIVATANNRIVVPKTNVETVEKKTQPLQSESSSKSSNHFLAILEN